MADFVEVATLDQLAPGHGMTVTVRGVPVALFNVEGTVYAIDDTCRHAGVSLGAGELAATLSGVAPTAGGTTSPRAIRCMIRRRGSRATRCRWSTGRFWWT
jgi:nitrite reductase/ring-hydroxylating ferredoxin subunit